MSEGTEYKQYTFDCEFVCVAICLSSGSDRHCLHFLKGTRLTSLLITGAEVNYLSKHFKAFNQHESHLECVFLWEHSLRDISKTKLCQFESDNGNIFGQDSLFGV